MKPILLATIAAGFLLNLSRGLAHWSPDPLNNDAVTSGGRIATGAQAAADEKGGAVICWEEGWGAGTQIYAQRVLHGEMEWAARGIRVAPTSAMQTLPQIAHDGSGGAIVCWIDSRDAADKEVYAQRISAGGNLEWGLTGIAVTSSTNSVEQFSMVGDSGAGIVVTWHDAGPEGEGLNVYAQRVSDDGNFAWGPDGVLIGSGPSNQAWPVLVKNRTHGYYFGWRDYDVDEYENDLFGQRVDDSGNIQWPATGLPICTELGRQDQLQVVEDGNTGAIFAWTDLRNGHLACNTCEPNSDIFAQRLDPDGTRLWTESGNAITTTTGPQGNFRIVPDTKGGAFVAWEDYRFGDLASEVFAQRLNADGLVGWSEGGVPVASGDGHRDQVRLLPDEADGVICVYRHAGMLDYDIHANRLSDNGLPIWAVPALVCGAEGSQGLPAISSSLYGGIIAVWEDARSGTAPDIYTSYLNGAGSLAMELPELKPRWSAVHEPVCSTRQKGTRCKLKADLLIENVGGLDAGPFTASFYASTDNQVSMDDLLLKPVKFRKVKSGGQVVKRIKVELPLDAPPSGWHLISVVDDGNKISELSETNNIAVWQME